MQIKKLLLPILATVMLICGCQQNNAVSGQDQLVTASENKTTYTAQNIPEYAGSPYVELNNNIPDFQESEYTMEAFEQYSDLDALGRCQAACQYLSGDHADSGTGENRHDQAFWMAYSEICLFIWDLFV